MILTVSAKNESGERKRYTFGRYNPSVNNQDIGLEKFNVLESNIEWVEQEFLVNEYSLLGIRYMVNRTVQFKDGFYLSLCKFSGHSFWQPIDLYQISLETEKRLQKCQLDINSDMLSCITIQNEQFLIINHEWGFYTDIDHGDSVTIILVIEKKK